MIADDLRHINYNKLTISDYSRRYILRMLPSIDYYLDIYRHCIAQLLTLLQQSPSDLTVVDYGGGHGFLSCLLKRQGFEKVIYIDYNPQAVETVRAVSQQLGYGPDIVLLGDAAILRTWCQENHILPDGLLGMDVIEHIYRLDTFFNDLHAIGPMSMVFTTGSTPYNPHIVHRLHKAMIADEQGRNGQPGFYQLRRQYLANHLPQLSDGQLDYWARHTRGLEFSDLLQAVGSGTPYPSYGPYNTCDPATGSWTERILPLKAYREILKPHRATVTVANGFYNTYRSGAKTIPSRLLNLLLRIPGPFFRPLAPFILLSINSGLQTVSNTRQE